MLKLSTFVVDWWIFLVIATVFFMYSVVLLLDAYKFLIVVPLFQNCSFSHYVVPLLYSSNSFFFFALNSVFSDNKITMSAFLWLVLPGIIRSIHLFPTSLCCFEKGFSTQTADLHLASSRLSLCVSTCCVKVAENKKKDGLGDLRTQVWIQLCSLPAVGTAHIP